MNKEKKEMFAVTLEWEDKSYNRDFEVVGVTDNESKAKELVEKVLKDVQNECKKISNDDFSCYKQSYGYYIESSGFWYDLRVKKTYHFN